LARTSERPRSSPATTPVETPARKPQKVFLSVTSVAASRLLLVRSRQAATAWSWKTSSSPCRPARQLRRSRRRQISEGCETK
jgi:hypothetical protein